ncbi:MAG: hypothetical protein KIS79_10935 [Burkholderiales bacterium]|nr:hypothetical protein [Burkholderiales bacterium]
MDDGIISDSITALEIHTETGYGGARVVIAGELAKACCWSATPSMPTC